MPFMVESFMGNPNDNFCLSQDDDVKSAFLGKIRIKMS